MKILQILFSGLGGHGSVVFSLLRGAANSQHRHVLVFYGIDDLAPGYAESCAALGVPYRLVKKRRGLDLRSWARLTEVLREEAADVVVLHSLSLIGAAGMHALTSRSKLIAVEHTPLASKRPVDWTCSVLAHQLADAVVYLTYEYAQAIRDRIGPAFRPEKAYTVGNGIDVGAFAPSPAGWREPGGVLRVGMMARFSAGKDHGTLIRAAARLRQLRGRRGPRVQLVLAGDGETLAEMKALAASLNLAPEDCLFPGIVAEQELVETLRGLHVYVQSSFGETMSTAVMQAMAAGLPVLASNVAGLDNMIIDGETGLLFPVGDADRLAGLLADLLDQPQRCKQLSARALAHAQARYSCAAMFHGYEAVFERVLGRGRGRTAPDWSLSRKAVSREPR